MKPLRYVLCDVFTDTPLAGNALAVFTDARGLSQERMQALARELNLSETTFITPAESGGTARVRIFTPKYEIPFGGHPTLGTAVVLAAPLERESLILETGVGPVTVTLLRDTPGSCLASFERPAPARLSPVATEEVREALATSAEILSHGVYDAGMRHLVVTMAHPADLRALMPSSQKLKDLPCDVVEACAKTADGVELRAFAPKHGITEDPATGSAVGPVLWHLHEQGLVADEQSISIAQGQAVARPSQLRGVVLNHEEAPQIRVSGQVVIVARGEFRLPS